MLCSFPAQSLSSHVSHRLPGVNIIPGVSGVHTVPLGHPALSMQQQECEDQANGQVFTLPCTTHLMLPPKSTISDLIRGIFPFPVLAGQRVEAGFISFWLASLLTGLVSLIMYFSQNKISGIQ